MSHCRVYLTNLFIFHGIVVHTYLVALVGYFIIKILWLACFYFLSVFAA